MKLLINTYNQTRSLHHAYVIEGNRNDIREHLFLFIENEVKIPIKGNPDVWHQEHDTFTIDEARKLREVQSNKALSDSKKIFIIELNGITIEAQNSLLKVFEEPTPNTHFFIIAPSSELFLPTFRSRVMIVSHDSENDFEEKSEQFLKKSIPERLKIVEQIVEEKNKVEAIKLIDGLIKVLHTKNRDSFILGELLKTRMFLNDRSPSLKLLLDHVSLII